MPIERIIHSTYVETTMSGAVDFGEICEHLLLLTEIEPTSSCFIEFIDLRQVNSIQVDPDQAMGIGKRVLSLHKKYDRSEIIAVAPADACFGVTRMLEAFVSLSNPTVSWHIMRDLESARKILQKLRSDLD